LARNVWLQRWLGEAYAKLYAEFGRETFTFVQAGKVLGIGAPRLHVAFSQLHAQGALIVFQRSKPRQYRLMDPRSIILISSGELMQAEFEREEYLELICDIFRVVRSRIGVVSFCVYGSVARSEAKLHSDLDILVVSDDFTGSIASRIDQLSSIDSETREEIEFLRRKGLSTAVSFMPLRREEAELTPILFLDLAVNSRMIYDRDGFLGTILKRLKARLDLAGSRRVETEKGWYWDLRPDFRPGTEEEVTI
jgi:predicted nucleotidyltransferase